MKNSITITRIEDIATFESLRGEWNTLLDKACEKDAFLTWEWLFAWWKNLGQRESRLWILAVRDGEKLIGIAPWMSNTKRKSFISLQRIENIGNPECDVSGIISIDPQTTADAICGYLINHKREWDILELNELPLSGTTIQHFLTGIEKSQLGLQKSVDEHFYIPTTMDWDEYYKSLSKNLRHNLQRRMRRAQEMGDVAFSHYSGDSLSWEIFQSIFELSEKSNFPDLYRTDENKSFHRDLFEYMRSSGWMSIETLAIDQRLVAFQYGFIFDGKYEDWRGGIDKEHEILAPGKLLMKQSLEWRFKSGLRESDFLRGIYSYKMDWLPSSREFASIQVYNLHNIISRMAYYWAHYIRKNQG